MTKTLREKGIKGLFLVSALFSMAALATITVFLLISGIPFIAHTGVAEFLLGRRWAILESPPSYGILPMIVATLYVTALSVILGTILGLFTSVCLFAFCPKKLVLPLRQLINLLAGIPSVIFGLFGMTTIVPFLRDYVSPNGVGYGILAASLVLAVMILPTVVSVSLDSLSAVPKSYYEGALALGATKEEAVFGIVLPAAKNGITAGIVLATGRALGETMAVMLVIGGSPEMPGSLFQSVRTLTANIAMGAMELKDDALSALIASGVVLFVFALLLNISFSALRCGKKKGVSHMDKKQHFPLRRRIFTGMKLISGVMTLLSVAALFAVIIYVFADGTDKLSFDLLFGSYTDTPSILPAFVGTLELILIAGVIAIPLGIATAVFLAEYTDGESTLVRLIRIAVETLAAIPSIVYGLFGYLVFVVACGWGYSMLGGGITLAIMILPVIVRSTEESLRSVPVSYREGAYALGAGKARAIFRVVLPAASGGIVTAVILAVGRIISESAVLILTIGMVVNKMPQSILSPGTSLALDIYYFASYGYPNEAAAPSVVLLAFVLIINLSASAVGRAIERKAGR